MDSISTDFYSKPIPLFNFTNKSPDELCRLALSFGEDKRFVIIVVIQAILSLLTLLVICLLISNKELRKFWSLITVDLKIIIFVGFSFYISLGCNAFLFFTYKALFLLFDSSPCPIWNGWNCYFYQRFFASSFIRSYGLVHFALFFERLWVTISKRQRCKGLIGFLLTAIIGMATIYPMLFIISPEMFSSIRVYCSNPMATVDKRLLYTTYIYISIDLVVTFGDFILYIVNKREIEWYKKQINTFDLEQSFKLRELQISINLIFPFSLVHSLFYCFQMYIFVVYSNNALSLSLIDENFAFEGVTLSRIFSTFAVLAFLLFYNKYRSQFKSLKIENSNAAELHFEELTRILS